LHCRCEIMPSEAIDFRANEFVAVHNFASTILNSYATQYTQHIERASFLVLGGDPHLCVFPCGTRSYNSLVRSLE
jgi:hypothetical protein